MIDEAINAIHRGASFDHKKEEEELRMEGRDELLGLFLEEDLILSILHKDQGISDSLISDFEYALALESSALSCLVVDPLGRCIEEANHFLGPGLQDHSPLLLNARSKVMDYAEPTCNGPDFCLGLKILLVVGLSDRAQI